ncbi:MFS transporter [Kordia algicida OT-1]|uniref:Major facilitator superfamily MFS_1 n=1 Tax=Kordia algicida OT-1 TaxID=391587 RepID=A9DQ85_9FLAO|nr:MFS transporter [Kordia algicida]EDP96600.1 major facilitator superfamily MFS_1 [Kordia algicida OT-1]
MEKRKLSFWEIWNMSFGFLGIQFGFALQNANTSRIFETLGAQVDDLAVYWLAAPVTGLVIQPIIGYFSDRTWHPKLGRRRPYFLVGAILASIALCLMPNSPLLWMAIGVLWIMDASINVSMEPFRAFVGDNLPEKQRTLGFAMQSFFIGIGGFVGSSLPYVFSNWLNISSEAPDGVIPDTVKYSFYFGAAAFLLAVLWTVLRSKEYSPEEFEAFEEQEKATNEENQQEVTRKKQSSVGIGMMIAGLLGTMGIVFYELKKDLYILTVGIAIVGLLFLLASYLRSKKADNGFVHIMTDLLRMPETMKQLAFVQFFSWFAMFSMWIYATSGVTSHIYKTVETTSKLYNEGADWVGFLMGIKFLVAAIVAFLLPVLAKYTNRKVTHLICLTLGGLGLISYFFITDPDYLLISMIGVGIAWASILSIPYAMLTGSLPASKMGYYMGVFNFFIVIPQIVAASILGFILTTFFNKEPIYALVVGGVSMIIAGILTLRVKDEATTAINEQ